ncbi:hypothetical protein BD560DRAFT_204284 [Blakeslea trispora]|nr:hypothetical protein BD560DRAFT_204284 [Blakeslea trispora]
MNSERQVEHFKAFQVKYLTVYGLVMGADWLQGPYLYKLYHFYGLELMQIAMLFLTGFVSGAFAGTVVGSLADTWGRKRICLVFCMITIVSLFLRMINDYAVLFLSHVLSGLSTALLYSVFESWYVSEHSAQGFPAEWRARTFALSTLLNSIVAILAGILANGLVDIWGLGAPYMASVGLLCLASIAISSLWTENYGHHATNARLIKTLSTGIHTLFESKDIMMIGLAQTLFECSMYIFVLLYTPAIEDTLAKMTSQSGENVPLGYLFSTMMLAAMTGSLCFQAVERQAKRMRCCMHFTEDRLLSIALGLASCAFMLMAYHVHLSASVLIISYHIFEFTTGLYYPAISSLKADAIPEETRAAVMTLLRIPMNLGVGMIMWHIEEMTSAVLFSICAIMTSIGGFLITAFYHPT